MNSVGTRAKAFVLLLIFLAGSVKAASFNATLDRAEVSVGETATLTLSFVGASPNSIPTLAPIQNLQAHYVGESSQFSFDNGQMSSSVSYNYQLTPVQPGEFTIPAIRVNVGGQILTSQPLKLKAMRSNVPPINDSTAEKQLAFMRMVLPKKQIYVGEVVQMELQLYFSSDVQNVDNLQFSPIQADGLNPGKFVKGQERQARIGNTIFRVVPVLIPLTAVKNGKLTLGPIDCTMNLQLPSNSRGRDPFDPFGMFQRAEVKRVTVSAQSEPVDLLELPKENAPGNFTGAVGNYSLTVTATPTNVTVGDPITVKIQINGRGAFDGLTLPEQPAWREFKTYPPASKVETSDQLGLQGTKTFEQVIVPQNAEIKELPPISFSFFDPDERKYRTLTSSAVPLIVKPGGMLPSPTLFASSFDKTAPPAQDIVHIKQRPGTLAEIQPPLAVQGWFLTLQGIPVVAWLGLLAWRKQAERLANNPRLRRQRHVTQVIRNGLHELKYYATDDYPDEFFATLFRLLQEQLGERLDVPASAITEAVIEEQLRPRGVSPEILTSLRELFQMCNQARYAPEHRHEELQSLIPKLESTIAELQKLKLK